MQSVGFNKDGIDSTFGVVSALILLIFVAISYFVITGTGVVENVPINRLLIITGCGSLHNSRYTQ